MPAAYARYLSHRMLGTRGPFLDAGVASRIGHWTGFSEYWTYLQLNSRREFAFLSRCAGGGVGIDVGANIGLFSLAMSGAGLDHVHAFEPIAATYSRLCANLELNNATAKITAHRLGVGREEGTVQFELDDGSPATSHLMPAGSSGARESVEIVRLDRFADEHSIAQVAMLKIDVEGMELDVLLGASELMATRRIAAGIIEICPQNLARYGIEPGQLLEFFDRHGYRLALLDDEGRPSIAADASRLRDTFLDNAAFFPA